MSLLLLLQFGFALHPYYGTGRGQAHRPKEYNYSRPFGGGEFRLFGRCPISLLLPLCRREEIGEQRQTNGSHKDTGTVQRIILCRYLKARRLYCTESIPYRKEGCVE